MRKKSMPDLHRITVQQFKQASKLPLVVVLDDVRSEMNVGSILRTADAFRVSGVWLCGITPVPPKAEIHKTALGAELSVDWRHYDDVMQAIAELRAQGYEILALEQVHGSTALQQFSPTPAGRYALLLGNEVKGVSQAAVDASDLCLEIPQCGTKHSLNVANSAAIAMWHFFSKLSLQ